MTLRLAVTGFAGGAPTTGACSSYVVSDAEHMLLLDCGPGTLERLWGFRMLKRIEAIVISHMNADHILDLLLIAGEIIRSELLTRPRLYVPMGDGPRVLSSLDAVFARGTPKLSRFDETFEVCEYDAESHLSLGTLSLSFAPTAHPQPCYAVRISDGECCLVYGADGAPSATLEELAAGADLLILEATFARDACAAAEREHMTAEQAGELAHRAGAKRLLLTHLIPGARGELRQLAAKHFHGRIDLAREGLTYDLA